jgi:uncharacterized membrane protein (DUF106 family)
MVIEIIQSWAVAYPRTFIIVAAILISLFISIVNYFVLDKEKMHALKARQKEIQEEMKKHKDNPTKLMELQKEMFTHMGSSFKHSMKPMLITFIPLILIFPVMRNALATTVIAKSWFWWYIGSSLVSSMIFRKWFKLP